jgi:hypothetical protein
MRYARRLTRDRLLLAGALIAGALLAWSGGFSPAVLATYIAGGVGLAAVQARLRLQFGPDVALVTTLLIFAATSLLWSMTRPGGLTETVCFALVAVAATALPLVARTTATTVASWVVIAAIPFAVRAVVERGAASGHWTETLFASDRGILALTPVAYVALVGLLLSLRRTGATAAAALLVIIVWFAGSVMLPPAAIEGRFAHGLTPALALLAPGLAVIIDMARRQPWLATAGLVAATVVWNYWLMVQYTTGAVPKDAPVSFGALVRQQADVATRSPYAYPFAFPANAWFAWREGLPVDRYELLAFEPRHPAIDLAIDRRAARFLVSGWDAFGSDGGDSQAWTRDREAILVVPLALPQGRPVDVAVTARARLEEPAVSASVGVVVNGREIGRLTVPPSAPLEATLRVGADVGGLWRAGYNRVAFVSHGVARLDPSDPRPPGPLARRLGDRPWPVAIYRLRIAAAGAP